MEKVNKRIAEWQKCINEYKQNSEQLQKRITRNLRTIWLQSQNYKKCDVQKLIDEIGMIVPVRNINLKVILI